MHFKYPRYTGLFLGFFYIVFPAIFHNSQAYAFSAGDSAQQHFDTATLSSWTITTSNALGSPSISQQTGQTGISADPFDTTPATNGLVVFPGGGCGSCS